MTFTLSEHPAGAAEYLRNGNPLPESSFAACEQADAILLGAMGLPSVRWPDGKEMTPQIDLARAAGSLQRRAADPALP